MDLKLTRTDFTNNSTIGELYVDGEFTCYILEDVTRDKKIQNETAIPYGEYTISITYSPRFKRNLPLLNNVPDFSGVRIHPGNKSTDTEGCLLPGTGKGKDIVYESRKAFDSLYSKLLTAHKNKEKITITITK
jgi:hypothetical protein